MIFTTKKSSNLCSLSLSFPFFSSPLVEFVAESARQELSSPLCVDPLVEFTAAFVWQVFSSSSCEVDDPGSVGIMLPAVLGACLSGDPQLPSLDQTQGLGWC